MAKRQTLSESNSLEFFYDLISHYSNLMQLFVELYDKGQILRDHSDVYGGITSYAQSVLDQVAKLEEYQESVLKSLYIYITSYYSNVREDIHSACTQADGLLYGKDKFYSNSMNNFFYNPYLKDDSTPVANEIGDPYKDLSSDYGLVELTLGEGQYARDAIRSLYGDKEVISQDDTNVRVKTSEVAMDSVYKDENGNNCVVAYGLLATKKTDIPTIAKETGVSEKDIRNFNIYNGTINADGTFKDGKNTMIIPAYKSTDSSVRVAAKTIENDSNGVYNIPSFEVNKKTSSSSSTFSQGKMSNASTSHNQPVPELTQMEVNELASLNLKISSGGYTEEDLSRQRELNQKRFGVN